MAEDEQWDFNKIQGANLTLLYDIISLSRELSVYWYFVVHQMKISSWSHGSNKQQWIASCSWLYGLNNCL